MTHCPFSAIAMSAPGTVLVSSFSSLKPLLRRIVLRVHPDVVSHLPQAHTAQNAASLQVLFRLFDGLRARLPEGAPPPPPPPLQPLAERHQLDFWFEPRSAAQSEGGGGDAAAAAPLEPRLLRREVRLPLGLEARCARLVGSGHSAAAAALWLGVGTGALADLGEGLGLHARGAVQLAPPLRAALREASGGADSAAGGRARAAAAQRMEPLSATATLRKHLQALSPLQQGKHESPGPPSLALAQALTAHPRTVFTLPQRRKRVEALLARPGWLTLRGASAAAAQRLRQALIAHFDALFLYHALWPALRLTLGAPYLAQASTGCLSVPEDFSDAELVYFVQRHWPQLALRGEKFSQAQGALKGSKKG